MPILSHFIKKDIFLSFKRKTQLIFPLSMMESGIINSRWALVPADSICKQFGPRSEPDKILGLIRVQTCMTI